MSRNMQIAAGVVGVAGLGFALWWLMRPKPITLTAVEVEKKAYDPQAAAMAKKAYEQVVNPPVNTGSVDAQNAVRNLR